MNYFAGLAIAKSGKSALTIGIFCNLLFLGIFKYAGFFVAQIAALGIPIPVPEIDLPIGISFYTFQSISYLVDVYRKEAPVQKSFGGLLLYISMFPQLIAGPIVRYEVVANEINSRHVSMQDLSDGLYRFFIGMGKKVIIANQFSVIAKYFLNGDMGELTTSGAWLGVAAFTLQIYFDFSGYSDMAIGMGRCMGFHFNENFNHPYCCNSITDFWRRWHMSLGSFFRDYVYIPLGGNRKHQYMNILIVWFLTGMWHGASWNFIIWGIYFGIIVSIEKFTILRIKTIFAQPFLHVYAMVMVVIGWGIFYFEDIERMINWFAVSFGLKNSGHNFITSSAITDNFWLWAIALAFCLPMRSWLAKGTARLVNDETRLQQIYFGTRMVYTVFTIIVGTALLVGATNNAFIYTRF